MEPGVEAVMAVSVDGRGRNDVLAASRTDSASVHSVSPRVSRTSGLPRCILLARSSTSTPARHRFDNQPLWHVAELQCGVLCNNQKFISNTHCEASRAR